VRRQFFPDFNRTGPLESPVNLNYEKIRAKVEHGGNHWTSYSDLFLVLSVVFLLLYVVANLRSSTLGLASHSAVQAMKQETEELKKQIKVYENMKDEYLKSDASSEEVGLYQELMGKLTLLEDSAKNERKELYKQAQAAQEKEQNLNRYQALVKNIISANLVASSKLKKRDDIIETKEADIQNLNRTVQEKEQTISKNNNTISQIEQQLTKQIEEVKYAYRSKKSQAKKMDQIIDGLKAEGEKKIASLRDQNSQYLSQLEKAQTAIVAKNREAERLLNTLNEKEAKFSETIGELERAHQAAMGREKKALEQGLQKEAEYQAAIARKQKLFEEKMSGLKGELEKTRTGIKDIEGKYQGSIASLKKSNSALEQGLKVSNAKLNAQRELADKIKGAFRANGINADVDGKTGDVTINFQDEYFETGRADLKDKMKSILEKTMPIYASSLFQDKKVAEKIGSVEIIGFASPTYKGKYVNPDSLSQDDRQAVNYNMDLSYQRAKSIFEHVFDTQKMQFPNQKTLLPLVKVSGKSYLSTDRLPASAVDGVSDEQYCKIHDCKKSQKVIIKFNLRDE
jgi:DNA repair exonuclease SbcCD ATPase subunit